ncbi:MAG: hypothetical protein AB2805_18460 [Candidatus Thiodiazotropha sp.]
MPEYISRFQPVDKLSPAEKQRIVTLYLQYYDAANHDQVLHDLECKREVLLLESENAIVGFTSLQVFNYRWRNQPIQVVYSGDTVVERKHWGQQTLAFRWIQRMTEIKQEEPEKPLYWFVIVKGHRTFKYLPAFGKSFYPHWSIDCSNLKPLADYIATDLFGEHYNPATGVVEYEHSRGHLKPDIAEPSEEELQKPSVRFFMEKNPNYRIGHELVCLCELEQSNMKAFTRRLATKKQNYELV